MSSARILTGRPKPTNSRSAAASTTCSRVGHLPPLALIAFRRRPAAPRRPAPCGRPDRSACAGLGLERFVEGLEGGVVLLLRMQEPVIAAGADDQALGQVLAEPLDRGFADRQHEGGLLQQAALAGLAHERIEIAAPGRREHHVGTQRQQPRNLGRVVRRAELRKQLGDDLHVGLHPLSAVEKISQLSRPQA